ncbi:hypothetical protein [Tabrizicola sp.]|uniref:hypothetical protein n=1 Tax=Tabrizicola sp. TaxID=2005166 RepID=UPI0027335B0A|nr:hypothetical protein [Tabrizicola sp.]MDP3193662.1 hypothetical protein [Tabrizicola sp.]
MNELIDHGSGGIGGRSLKVQVALAALGRRRSSFPLSTLLLLCLSQPTLSEITREPTKEEGEALDSFATNQGIPSQEIADRWMACTSQGASDPVECTKLIPTPKWVPYIGKDPISDALTAGVFYTTAAGGLVSLVCGGQDGVETAVSVTTPFYISIDAPQVVTRLDEGEAEENDVWSRSADGMAAELRGKPAEKLIASLKQARKFAYRITSETGSDTQVIDVAALSNEGRTVIEACGW